MGMKSLYCRRIISACGGDLIPGSSPTCAVQSLSGHLRLWFAHCSAPVAVLLGHLLGLRRLPLVVRRQGKSTFARAPDLVWRCPSGPAPSPCGGRAGDHPDDAFPPATRLVKPRHPLRGPQPYAILLRQAQPRERLVPPLRPDRACTGRLALQPCRHGRQGRTCGQPIGCRNEPRAPWGPLPPPGPRRAAQHRALEGDVTPRPDDALAGPLDGVDQPRRVVRHAPRTSAPAPPGPAGTPVRPGAR